MQNKGGNGWSMKQTTLNSSGNRPSNHSVLKVWLSVVKMLWIVLQISESLATALLLTNASETRNSSLFCCQRFFVWAYLSSNKLAQTWVRNMSFFFFELASHCQCSTNERNRSSYYKYCDYDLWKHVSLAMSDAHVQLAGWNIIQCSFKGLLTCRWHKSRMFIPTRNRRKRTSA